MSKKLYSFFFLSVLLFTLGFTFTEKTTFAANQDSELLYDKAKLGISDLSTEEMQSILDHVDVELFNDSFKSLNQLSQFNNKDSFDIKTYATAEISESTEDSKLITLHTFSDIYLNDAKNDTYLKNDIKALSSNWSGDLYDNTGSVRAKLTLVIDAKTVSGVSMLRLKRGYGSWTIVDRRVQSITNKYVGFANGGLGETGKPVNQSFGPYFLTSNSFDKTLNGSYVGKDIQHTILGNMTATLSTNSSSWNFKMVLRFPEPASKS